MSLPTPGGAAQAVKQASSTLLISQFNQSAGERGRRGDRAVVRPLFIRHLQWLPYFHSSPPPKWAVRRKRYAPLSPPRRIGSLICQKPVLFKKIADSFHVAIIGKIIDFLTSISRVILANVKEGLLIVSLWPLVTITQLKEAYCATLYLHLTATITRRTHMKLPLFAQPSTTCHLCLPDRLFLFYG